MIRNLEKLGEKIVKLLVKGGHQAFFVGGFVRDGLLQRNSDNLDIATDALPDQIEQILENAGLPTKPVGKKYGTILVPLKFPVEVTTFRTEGRYSDRRHPDFVSFAKDYKTDAKRRDFTINAFYFDPISKQLLDPTGGLKDLNAKIVRFVGDPKKRIDEDHLRMLRAVRIVAQLGFSAKGARLPDGQGPASGWKIEKDSFAAIKTRAKYIQTVSGERVKAELDKILLFKSRAGGLRLLGSAGLLKFIIPEMEGLKSFSHQSKHYHLEGNMFEHTLLALNKVRNSDLNVLYAVLFYDIGKPGMAQRVLKDEGWVISTRGHVRESAEIFSKFAKKLRFSRQQRESIEWLIQNHEVRRFVRLDQTDQVALVLDPRFALLLEVWFADFAGNIRKSTNENYANIIKSGQNLGLNFLKKVKSKKRVLEKLTRGDLIMKYAVLKPSKELGKKILEVKTQIVLGKIKNQADLKNFLQGNGQKHLTS